MRCHRRRRATLQKFRNPLSRLELRRYGAVWTFAMGYWGCRASITFTSLARASAATPSRSELPVIIYTGDRGLMNALGRLQVRVASLMSYAY